jgi:hypothetical protein
MFINRFEIHTWYTVIILVHLVMFVQWSGLFFHVQIHDNFVLTVVLMLETSKKHIFKMFGFTLSTIVNNVSYVHQTHTRSCLCPKCAIKSSSTLVTLVVCLSCMIFSTTH